jgi:hypothetical protein
VIVDNERSAWFSDFEVCETTAVLGCYFPSQGVHVTDLPKVKKLTSGQLTCGFTCHMGICG